MNRRFFIKSATAAGVGLGLMSKSLVAFSDEKQDLCPILIDSQGQPITSLAKWKKQRKVIRKRWCDYLGVLKPNPSPPVLKVINEDRPEGLIRQLVEYEGEPGITVQGYLIKPEVIAKSLPGIVAMHSTSDKGMIYIAGVEKGEIVAFGYKLAQLGFVVFCPMCFLWHDKGDRTSEQQVQIFHERHPGSKGMAKILFDAMRAVDILENLKEVDAARIGAMGHSLGAKEAFYLGAFDDRVKVVVSNEGGIGIDFSNWDAIWYLGEEIHEFGHKHHEVLSLVAPKPFLLIGGDSADGEISRPYIEAVLPVYDLYGKNLRNNLILKNHGTGHSVAPIAEKWTYDWLTEFLLQES
jgi:hypothetical protein